MRALLVVGCLVSAQAVAATAFFTGRQTYATTVTYQQGVRCEYDYAGNKFWRTFVGGVCPTSIEVE